MKISFQIDEIEDKNNFKIEIIGHVQLEFNSNLSSHFWLRPNSDTLKLTLIYIFKLCGEERCKINVRISWVFNELYVLLTLSNRNEPSLLMEPTNVEPTDRYKIMIKAVSNKPKENVQRNWYESSKIKITKISCGIWVKSGKARCILNAFTRNH